MTSNSYLAFVKQIDEIAEENHLHDYHAFVYWFIENMMDEASKQKILDSICDGTHDKGIDAILVDGIERKVTIIQSKYEHEGNKVQIKESEIKILASVREYLKSRKALDAITAKANPSARRLLNEAYDSVKRGFSWELVFITTHRNAPQIQSLLRDVLGFKPEQFSVWHYDDIIQLHKDRMRDFTPRLPSYNLPYKFADSNMMRKEGSKAWVMSMPLEEIRSLVIKHRDKLFRKNVRDFLGDNITSKGIKQTLEGDQWKFWYFNNGMCILCDEANLVPEQNYIRIVNPQIINGCQTARSLERYSGELTGDVLVRVIESKDHEFVNAITLYQNTSNPVKKRDLKSNDPVQIRLKNEFKRQHWYYETKRGQEFKKMAKKNRSMKTYYKSDSILGYKTIDNEDVAKVLAAINVNPPTAVSKGSDYFFDDIYDKIFFPIISTANCLAPLILYWRIKDTYDSRRFHAFPKGQAFKNPASYYVLRFIYDSFGSTSRWEKDLITAYENGDARKWRKFYRSVSRVSSEMFELIYDSWKRSGEPDHRTYLGNQKTFSEIREKNRAKLSKPERAAAQALNELIS